MRKKNENKNKKRKLAFYKILMIIMLLVSFIFMGLIYWLDVLPINYFIKILFGVLILDFILVFLLIKKNIKKKIKKAASVFSIIFILIMLVASFYLYKTLGFFGSIDDGKYKIENYSVIVLKDSKYKKINSIKGVTVGAYTNSSGYKIANEKLKRVVNVKFKKYDELLSIGEDLLSSDVKVIVLEDSMKKMLSEELDGFENKVKVIYRFSIKTKVDNDAKDVNVTTKPFSIYISGIDTYGEISTVSRSDVNIVATVNPKTKQVLLVSIPRDYYVQLNGTTGRRDKLTHAGLYGVEKSITTIQDLLGIEINYYFKVNFTSLVDIVNTLGGINAYSDYTFTAFDGTKFTKGYNTMNGKQALSFSRERKAFPEGDRQRGKNQQAVIEALIRKVSNKSVITKYNSLLNDLNGKFQTNMGQRKMTSLIKMQLSDMAKWTVTSFALDGGDGREYTYTYGGQKLYVMIPYKDSITQAKALIDSVYNGEKLAGSYVEYTGSSTLVTTNTSSSSTENKKTEVQKKETPKKESQVKTETNTKLTHIVTVYDENGSVKQSLTIEDGKSANPVANAKEGYKWIGWKDKNTDQIVNLSSIKKDMEIYPYYEKEESKDPEDIIINP